MAYLFKKNFFFERTDKRTNGQTHERTNERTDGPILYAPNFIWGHKTVVITFRELVNMEKDALLSKVIACVYP